MGSKYTEAQNKATQKYIKSTYDTIPVRAKKGTREIWKEEAEKRDKSLNQFIIDSVEAEIEKK